VLRVRLPDGVSSVELVTSDGRGVRCTALPCRPDASNPATPGCIDITPLQHDPRDERGAWENGGEMVGAMTTFGIDRGCGSPHVVESLRTVLLDWEGGAK